MKKLAPWLQSGIKGVIVCIILFFFYIVIYFPVIDYVYAKDIANYGGTPAWTTALPTLTGHFFPLFSGFIVPYGFLCPKTETICVSWYKTAEFGGVPWTLEGEKGYCLKQELTVTSSCAEFSEKVGFFSFLFLLSLIYFAAGAFMSWLTKKRKSR